METLSNYAVQSTYLKQRTASSPKEAPVVTKRMMSASRTRHNSAAVASDASLHARSSGGACLEAEHNLKRVWRQRELVHDRQRVSNRGLGRKLNRRPKEEGRTDAVTLHRDSSPLKRAWRAKDSSEQLLLGIVGAASPQRVEQVGGRCSPLKQQLGVRCSSPLKQQWRKEQPAPLTAVVIDTSSGVEVGAESVIPTTHLVCPLKEQWRKDQIVMPVLADTTPIEAREIRRSSSPLKQKWRHGQLPTPITAGNSPLPAGESGRAKSIIAELRSTSPLKQQWRGDEQQKELLADSKLPLMILIEVDLPSTTGQSDLAPASSTPMHPPAVVLEAVGSHQQGEHMPQVESPPASLHLLESAVIDPTASLSNMKGVLDHLWHQNQHARDQLDAKRAQIEHRDGLAHTDVGATLQNALPPPKSGYAAWLESITAKVHKEIQIK